MHRFSTHFSTLLGISLLALIISGCGEGEAPPAASPAASPAPTAAAPAAPPAAPKPAPGQAFPKPTVPAQPVARAVTGLIPPSNSDERFKQVQRGRNDPFAIINVTPEKLPAPPKEPGTAATRRPVTPPTDIPGGAAARPRDTRLRWTRRLPGGVNPGTTGNPVATNPGNTNPGNPGTVNPGAGNPGTVNPGAGNPGTVNPGGTRPGSVAGGTVRPGSPGIVVPPPLPQPDAARAVAVTGVVTVGGVPQAIVRAPDEPTSRTVRVGQRLSNGQVLVKRIETGAGSDPVVILEQYGIEVAKGVGESTAESQRPAS